IRISDRYTITIHDINTIIVPKSSAVNCNTIYTQIFTLIKSLYPGSSITHSDSAYQHIFTRPKIDQHRPDLHFGPVITKSIFDKSFMNEGRHISRNLSSLSINNSFPGNSNILLILTY